MLCPNTQDISENLTNLHIITWKGTFQAFHSYWESKWLLIHRRTPIGDQESPAVHKGMLCNAIC